MKSAYYKFKSSIKKHRDNMAFIVARRYPDVPFFVSSLLFNQPRTRLRANYTEDDEAIYESIFN